MELGCGLGVGAGLVAAEFDVLVTAMDRSSAQLERALTVNAGAIKALGGALSLRTRARSPISPGATVPWTASSPSRCSSTSTTSPPWHARPTGSSAPGGRFAAATFFAPDTAETAAIADLLESVASGVDVIRPVGDFAADLTAAGFADVAVESIGEHVWRQLDRWIAQTEFRDLLGLGTSCAATRTA